MARRIDDPDYLSAQIDCLRSLLLVVAGLTTEREQFIGEAMAALERLRIATLHLPTSDARLQAIDDCEAVLQARARS